jgi:hypothetical protein
MRLKFKQHPMSHCSTGVESVPIGQKNGMFKSSEYFNEGVVQTTLKK